MKDDLNKNLKKYFSIRICIVILTILKYDLNNCQIKDNYNTNVLEEGKYDLLDVTDYHNMNLIVTASKNIYTGLPPTLKTTTTANLINVTSIITLNNNFLLAACLQDSLLTKININNGESTSLLEYSDINYSSFLGVPTTTCSLSFIDNNVFIGYSMIDLKLLKQLNKTIIVMKIEIINDNSDMGPIVSDKREIKYFTFPLTTIKTNSHRQISCEPLKISNNINNYRLVCMYLTTGYYSNKLEYMLYATSINENFNNFENTMNELKQTWSENEFDFRIYKVNDTYLRCLTNETLTGICLKTDNRKVIIEKVLVNDNLYSLSADLDLTSYSNNLRFSAKKVDFMNKNNVYYFQIKKETSNNYLKLYDYKENKIKKILGYYNTINDYIILVYQTQDKIKYFTLQNNEDIYNISPHFNSIQMKTYEHIEYNMNNIFGDISNLGNLNIEIITRNISGVITTEKYGIDFYELFMDNNIFIPEKSMNTWYRYNFSFVEHAENNYTRIYYLEYISIIVKTCYSFICNSCWKDYNQCDQCTNNNEYGLLSDDTTKCYPINLLVKGYVYNETSRKFEKCYYSCDFCYESSIDSSNHKCESCKEGYLFSYEKLGNCYDINNLQIEDEKTVNNGKFISSNCNNNKILSTGECIDNCPNTNIYYSFEYDINNSNYIKTLIISPKYLFNKKCYVMMNVLYIQFMMKIKYVNVNMHFILIMKKLHAILILIVYLIILIKIKIQINVILL